MVEHRGVRTGWQGQTNQGTDGQDGGAAASHWGAGGQTDSHVGGLRSVTQGWETQMDRQTGGLCGVTPGGGAAGAGSQTDGQDGHRAAVPVPLGRWADGWSRTRGLWEHRERGAISSKTPYLGGSPAMVPPAPTLGGLRGCAALTEKRGVEGRGVPAPPWAMECRGSQPLPLRAQGGWTPSLTGEGRQCRGAWLTTSGAEGGLCSHGGCRGSRRAAVGHTGVHQ